MEAKLGAMNSDPKETKNLLENHGVYKILGSGTIRGTNPQDTVRILVLYCYIKNYRKLSSLKKKTDFFSYGSGGLKFKGQGVGRALFLLEAPGKTRVLVVPGCRRLQRPESSGLPTWHLRTIPCGRGFRCHFSPLVPPAPCSLGPWRLP